MPAAPPAPPPSARVIEARGVRKSFKRGSTSTLVLDGVDLSIDAGECAMLVGPSGSGKTTLMSVIGCVLSPDEGRVRVLGHDVAELDAGQKADLRRRRIGFVFQRHHLIRGLNALENVGVPLKLEGRPDHEITARARELLERVGLSDRAGYEPSRLSVGQCQRVALARALAADPEIVLADEPTAALDAESGQQAMRLLTELTVEAGKTLVVVTHDHRVLPFATRILSMENGRIVRCA